MTCREFAGFIAAYLDGELEVRQREEFDRHMAVCPWCVAYLETYQETVLLGKGAFSDPGAGVPEEVPEELVEAILGARRR